MVIVIVSSRTGKSGGFESEIKAYNSLHFGSLDRKNEKLYNKSEKGAPRQAVGLGF